MFEIQELEELTYHKFKVFQKFEIVPNGARYEFVMTWGRNQNIGHVNVETSLWERIPSH